MSNLTGRGPYQKAGIIDDPKFRKKWLEAHPVCAYCGRREYRPHSMRGPHHILGYPNRSDEACNLLCLGWLPCHRLAEGDTIVDGDRILEPLTLAHVLWLKRVTDPDEWDLGRLEQLKGERLPEPVRPPNYRGPFGRRAVTEVVDAELAAYRQFAREAWDAVCRGLSEAQRRKKLARLMGPHKLRITEYSLQDCERLIERLRV